MSTIIRKLSTDPFLQPTQVFLMAVLWLGMAIISTGVAVLFRLHSRLALSLYRIFDLSFYYVIPALLWIIITPFIFYWAQKYPLAKTKWKGHLRQHLLLASLLAPLLRFIALYFDFSIKWQLGMVEQSPLKIIKEVYLLGLASIPGEFFNYFFVLGVYYLLKNGTQVETTANPRPLLAIRQGQQHIHLPIEDLYGAEAAGNYVLLFTADKSYRIRKTIKGLNEELSAFGFFRIHRSVLVNAKYVHSLWHWRRGEYLVLMKNEKRFTSSRTYLQNIQQMKL
ncbi:MAG: LytTR family DNA-binding domain-containing protein [Saprospiraceae bacterium]